MKRAEEREVKRAEEGDVKMAEERDVKRAEEGDVKKNYFTIKDIYMFIISIHLQSTSLLTTYFITMIDIYTTLIF